MRERFWFFQTRMGTLCRWLTPSSAKKPDAVLHLGDHTDDADDIRRAFPALTIYHVRGNNDFDMDVPLFAVVTVGGVRMYLTHGHRERVSMLHSGLVQGRGKRAARLRFSVIRTA